MRSPRWGRSVSLQARDECTQAQGRQLLGAAFFSRTSCHLDNHSSWRGLPQARTGRGFTLIEVLISILVLAIGMFGAAALQLGALRTTQQSSMHTAALALAADLADKMRMNTVATGKADADNAFLKIDFSASTSTGEATAIDKPAKFCNLTEECNADELAAFDIYEWKVRLQALLPTGRAVVCRDTTAWDVLANRYKWECSSNNAPVTVKIGWVGKTANGSLERLTDGTLIPNVALVVAPFAQ